MAIDKKKKLLDLFNRLPESEQTSVIDYLEYLAQRDQMKLLKNFHDNLPDEDEELSEEELRQLGDNGEYLTGEEAKRAYDLDLP